jgi:hypothetical protein
VYGGDLVYNFKCHLCVRIETRVQVHTFEVDKLTSVVYATLLCTLCRYIYFLGQLINYDGTTRRHSNIFI